MLTMGVARSLGDYDLIHRASLVNMKDFLTPQPEVRVYKAYSHKFSPEDVLVMATDGMWDVVTNTEVQRELQARPGGLKQEIGHTKMAKALVELARAGTCTSIPIFLILLPSPDGWMGQCGCRVE